MCVSTPLPGTPAGLWSSSQGRCVQSLASCPPAVQPVEDVHQPERNRGGKRNYVPHVDHIGDPATDKSQRNEERVPDPKREAWLVQREKERIPGSERESR